MSPNPNKIFNVIYADKPAVEIQTIRLLMTTLANETPAFETELECLLVGNSVMLDTTKIVRTN